MTSITISTEINRSDLSFFNHTLDVGQGLTQIYVLDDKLIFSFDDDRLKLSINADRQTE